MSLDNTLFDINCDLGEIDPSLALERKIMPLIGRCNIACGGHAGNPQTMRETIFIALNHGVKIGAHPSYPDIDNFGRIRLKMSDAVLMKSIEKQVTIFLDEVENCGATIDHIKAHGALYHYLNEYEPAAHLYLKLIENMIPEIKLLIPEKSVICDIIADYPMGLIYEAFADRQYNIDKTLQSRKVQGSVITDPEKVLNQVKSIVHEGGVLVDDSFLTLKANSICVHSDTENASEIIQVINDFFQ